MKKLSGYLKLTRPINCIITMLVVIVGGLISSDEKFTENILIYCSLIAALVAASGNVINDYFDVEIDKIVHPERPLAEGIISKKNALIFYLFLITIALVASSFLTTEIFIVVLITITILFLYSAYLKKILLMGNIIISFLTGLAFLFGGIAVGNVKAAIIPAVFAFLTNFIREVVKDTEDIEGDKRNSIITFPVKYGIRKTRKLVLLVSIVLILFTFYPFISSLYKIEFFVIIMILVNPILIFSLKIFYIEKNKKDIHKVSLLLKLDMIFGLIAIFLGK